MYNIRSKKRAVTIIEIVIAFVILTLVILVTLSSVGTLYKNSYTGNIVTNDVYSNKKNLEEMSYVIRSFAFENKSNMADLIKQIDNDYDATKASDIKTKLSSLNCTYIPNIDLFNTGSSSNYACTIDGFSLYSYSANTSDDIQKLHVFVPNSGAYIKYYMLKNAYIMDKKHNNKKAKYNYVLNPNALAAFKTMLEETKKYAETFAYTKYQWQFAPVHYEDSMDASKNRVFEAVFDNNDKLPSAVDPDEIYSSDFGTVIENAIARLKYPDSDTYYNTWTGANNFVTDSSVVTEDGYLRCNLQLLYNFKYNGKNVMNEFVTQPVYLINLPLIDNLIYHYAFGMDGEFVDASSRKTNNVYELSQILDNSYANDAYNLKHNSASNFTLNSDGVYYHYQTLSNSENELSANTRGPSSSDGRNEMTLFLVVDLDDAASGTIIQRKNSSDSNKKYFALDYDNVASRLTLYSGPKNETAYYNKNKLSLPLYTHGKHIIVLEVTREGSGGKLRKNYLLADTKTSNFTSIMMKKKALINWYPDKRNDYNALNNDTKLLIGGAKGAKLYEVIGYSDALSNSDVTKVCKYLAKKYDLPDNY